MVKEETTATTYLYIVSLYNYQMEKIKKGMAGIKEIDKKSIILLILSLITAALFIASFK